MSEPKCKNGHVWFVPTGEKFVEGQPCECGEKPYELDPHEREIADLEDEVARLRSALEAIPCRFNVPCKELAECHGTDPGACPRCEVLAESPEAQR